MKDLSRLLCEKSPLGHSDSNAFVVTFFDIIKEALFRDGVVKVKGLGTFKMMTVKQRESVNVNTGERVIIDSHDRVSFTPDASMRDSVNKPFSQFETVILNEGVTFDDIESTNEDSIESEVTIAPQTVILEPVSEPEVASDPEPVSNPVVVSEPEVASDPEPVSESEVVSEPEPDVVSEPAPVSVSEVVSESEPEVVSELEPIAEPEVEKKYESILEFVMRTKQSKNEDSSEQSDENSSEQLDGGCSVQTIENSSEQSDGGCSVQTIENSSEQSDEDYSVQTTEDSPELIDEHSSEPTVEDSSQSKAEDSTEPTLEDSTELTDEDYTVELDEEPESGRHWLKTIARIVAVLIVLLIVFAGGFVAGHEMRDISWNDLSPFNTDTLSVAQMLAKKLPSVNPDTLGDSAKVIQPVNEKADSIQAKNAEEKAAKEQADKLAADKAAKEQADKLAADKTAKEQADKLAADKAAKEQAENANNWDYRKYESDPRIKHGAYRIVGIARTIKVKPGETLHSITTKTLGAQMDCYVEALNGKEVPVGQMLKLPKLELKKKKK